MWWRHSARRSISLTPKAAEWRGWPVTKPIGLQAFLPPALQAPIIVTVHAPKHGNWQFREFYERVKALGFVLYPGKLTELETFRVGCIGAIGQSDMLAAVAAMDRVLREMGIRSA